MESQDIKDAKIIKSVKATDYVFVLQEGILCKILVMDLKQSLK